MPSALLEAISNWTFVDIFNMCVLLAFSICYFYQLVYVGVGLIKRPPRHKAKKDHLFAVLISARNEQEVIGDLLDSLAAQDYPPELFDVFVVADNCTDDTASIAREHGAHVFSRENKRRIGKGYALNWGLHRIWEAFDPACCEQGTEAPVDFAQAAKGMPSGANASWRRGAKECPYEAYIVFDADNVVTPGYIKAMNATYDSGAKASTSYRNSKNFGANWISAGYGIWFLREARFLSQPRLCLGTSCAISGTGFFIAHDVLRDAGGWKWHLLTEDIEFSADEITKGTRISYCPDAVFFDEQPETFKTSWNQRYRWAKGFYQVFARYGGGLVKGIFANARGGKWACYDMLMTISPGMLLTVITLAFNVVIALLCAAGVMSLGNALVSSVSSIVFCIANFCFFMFVLGAITVTVEWEHIAAPSWKKVLYCITFPLFMLSYVPIAICALFGKARWTPIPHNVHMDAIPGGAGVVISGAGTGAGGAGVIGGAADTGSGVAVGGNAGAGTSVDAGLRIG